MRKKKGLTPAEYRKRTKKYLSTRQPLKGKKAAKTVKARSQHYARGAGLISEVSRTLKKLAAKHPDPKARKQADMAIKKLNDAQASFGVAGMCQGTSFDKDDT